MNKKNVIPNDFDWKTYVNINPDLHLIKNKRSAEMHYLMYGIKENRKYSNETFNDKIEYTDNYYDSLEKFTDIYKVTDKSVYTDPKIEFRYFCFKFLDDIRKIQLDDIIINSTFEAVLVEYRCFPHIEFIIRNNIFKLGNKWSFTIICGNLNYDFITKLALNISKNIKVIKTDYDNLCQSEYSDLLTTEYFWNLLHGEKILIYQEDSIIFKSNIDDFLEWDYIGAPWPKIQNDNDKCVGNGGLSLRTKKCMIEVIKNISISETKYNTHTITYMKHAGLTNGPEDVYFSLNMIKYNIGKIPDSNIASFFSTEMIYNENSFGGHNFWLATTSWKNYLFKHVLHNTTQNFNICAISTPYGLKMGGGECYLLNIAKYFINYKNCIIYFFVDEDKIIAKKTIDRILNSSYQNYFVLFNYKEIFNYQKKVTYHVNMCNSKYPSIPGCAINIDNNFFHCQFPFDTDKNNTNNINIASYKNIILNSDYSKKYYDYFTSSNKNITNKHIIYPNCFNQYFSDNIIINKLSNSFVMTGRIFDYNPCANNKNFDIALKYFEDLTLNNITDFHVHIIGEIYSTKMLEKLKSFNIKNIYFHTNISNEEKYNILSTCKYFINMVGINRDIITECYAYEHFGISIIEAIKFQCIPISINGGYSPYYIKENKGYLFNNETEFYNILKNIIVNKLEIEFDKNYYDEIIQKFSQKSFNINMDSLFNPSMLKP